MGRTQLDVGLEMDSVTEVELYMLGLAGGLDAHGLMWANTGTRARQHGCGWTRMHEALAWL